MATAVERETRSAQHPPGLYALFAAEMWERFSFYGMRALLVLYLTKKIGMNRPDALGVYAVYTGLVYLTPLVGGRLADRYLGQRKAVFIGGLLMAIGQFTLTQPSLLNLGLGLMILGNGFFKPNISSMVGTLYPKGDHRLDGAYTLFYMGINLGAFLSPLVCGPLGENYGWWPGFATAGVGMILGLLCFLFTQRLLQGGGLPPGRPAVHGAVLNARDYVEILVITTLCVAGIFAAIQFWPMIEPLWSPRWLDRFAPSKEGAIPFAAVAYKGAVLIGILGVFLYLTEPRRTSKAATPLHEKMTGEDWQRVVVILIISLFSIVFWAGFEQSGGTLNLFADEKTNRTFFGWTVPASVLQSINPLFIILLAPVFAVLWTYLAKRQFPLPSFAKQGLGLILLGLAFVIMYFADEMAKTHKVSMLWLIATYFVFTVAELFISPIGLSLVNKLAPLKLASLMMAVWFLCTAAANYLAGIMERTIEPYHLNLWAFLGVVAFVPGVLMLLLTPLLLKISHGKA